MGAQDKLTLRPLGLWDPAEGEAAEGPRRLLAGGPLSFGHCEAVLRSDQGLRRAALSLPAIEAWAEEQTPGLGAEAAAILQRLSSPRGSLGGLTLERPRIMGILNITPDSFSDGGDRFDPEVAVRDGLAMLEEGADILDVGGESTRPGAAAISLEEERARVLPVVKGLVQAGACVSIDTRHAAIMQDAVAAGAAMINDVTALAGDPDSLAVAAAAEVPVILMHMQGEPRTMQQDPRYRHVALDIYDYLAERLEACAAAGIALERLVVDPGIGFGKTVAHNLQLLEQIAVFHGLGCPVLLGASRKSFIARLSHGEAPKDRLPGSLAAVLFALQRGVQILRVHDVAETAQAVAVWQAMMQAPSGFGATDKGHRALV
ncbi:dihydropteroate synthase [Pelagibius sp.]|uniref:dihydropteroate synthase n=1 Tax=Pelagibius sp. TaxID=1931238 RepID=UPI00262FE2AC|nr:dihydropteroate synthase [Pelagibius sp.]